MDSGGARPDVDAVLLDIDGVLVTSWEPIPGAAETIAWLRSHAVPFRLLTNTTTHTRAGLADTLSGAGIPIASDEIVTAVVATAMYLRTHYSGARVFVLSDGDATADLEDVHLAGVDRADVIVLGGACEDFSYPTMNAVFRRLMEGAALVGMHRNLYWRTAGGWELDGGAYLAGLEASSGRTAEVCGKPAAGFFLSALEPLGVPPERALMVGDDLVNDVLGASVAGLTGVLVRTGKFRPSDVEPDRQDAVRVIDSIADLPELLRAS